MAWRGIDLRDRDESPAPTSRLVTIPGLDGEPVTVDVGVPLWTSAGMPSGAKTCRDRFMKPGQMMARALSDACDEVDALRVLLDRATGENAELAEAVEQLLDTPYYSRRWPDVEAQVVALLNKRLTRQPAPTPTTEGEQPS